MKKKKYETLHEKIIQTQLYSIVLNFVLSPVFHTTVPKPKALPLVA